MLTSIRISNFKKFTTTQTIPLDRSVVFIGPNNSGKTTALQALALWFLGIHKWLEKRGEKSKAKSKTGVAINRKDVYAIPTPNAKYLWNNLDTKKFRTNEKILIQIIVEGMTEGIEWKCGFAFDYFGEEVLYCRPLDPDNNIIINNPDILRKTKIAYLPPMSGLVAQEAKLLSTAVNARIGEGRTAEVLRNLCYFILHPETDDQVNGKSTKENWDFFSSSIRNLFGVTINEPQLNERGEIEQTYVDENENILDLTSSGRGLQQVMLLLAYMLSNPHSVLLLDEPDAHLEILRQRHIYKVLNEIARGNGSQIIAASHSEVILQEAANEDTVIAFIGKPHKLNDKGSQLLKSLTTIGFDNYYLAELRKWILYVEGPTDFSMLQAFAKIVKHPVEKILNDCFVHYVSVNLPAKARDHFFGLKEAVPYLKGIAIFDRIDNTLQKDDLKEFAWKKRELENYFFSPSLLKKFAVGKFSDDLFGAAEAEKRRSAMNEAITQIIPPIALGDPNDEFWTEQKASEQMDRIFRQYFRILGAYNVMDKNKFYELIELMEAKDVDKEIIDALDNINSVATSVMNLE